MNKRPLILRGDNDTIVECKKCGRRQHLKFVNGLKNGWSECCGFTMPIVHCIANIEKAVKTLVIPPVSSLFCSESKSNKEEPWSVS